MVLLLFYPTRLVLLFSSYYKSIIFNMAIQELTAWEDSKELISSVNFHRFTLQNSTPDKPLPNFFHS